MKRSEFLKAAAVVAATPWLDNLLRGSDRLAAISPAETTITTSRGYFHLGDIVRVTSTGEAMQVTALQTTREGWRLTVRRGIGSVKPKRMHRGDQLITVGNPVSEGQDLRYESGSRISEVA